jgi:hypothetical protein
MRFIHICRTNVLYILQAAVEAEAVHSSLHKSTSSSSIKGESELDDATSVTGPTLITATTTAATSLPTASLNISAPDDHYTASEASASDVSTNMDTDVDTDVIRAGESHQVYNVEVVATGLKHMLLYCSATTQLL